MFLILLKHFCRENQEFTGSFDGFDIPNVLGMLLNWIITNPKSKIVSECTKKKEVEELVKMLSEMNMNVVKIKRQR